MGSLCGAIIWAPLCGANNGEQIARILLREDLFWFEESKDTMLTRGLCFRHIRRTVLSEVSEARWKMVDRGMGDKLWDSHLGVAQLFLSISIEPSLLPCNHKFRRTNVSNNRQTEHSIHLEINLSAYIQKASDVAGLAILAKKNGLKWPKIA